MNKKVHFKEYQKFIKQFQKISFTNLILFICDLIIFSVIFTGFILEVSSILDSSNGEKTVAYVVLVLSFYILIKFTITNFFYNNIYFVKLHIYNKEIVIDDVKIEKNENICMTPFWFLTILILINIFSTIIINYQADTAFENKPIISACVSTMASILLIPSFSAILNKVTEIKKPVVNNYTNLVKQQFVSFEKIFENYEESENFEFINFKELSLQSKKGIFLITKDKKNKSEFEKFNKEIIEIYDIIWKKYYQLLYSTRNINSKSKTQYLIERQFDSIFINFLEW
ncbi:hypothetical protein [Spiroplasma endosymbiont of Panorpa germanica]|uniref:hypothetical protein n=1 Tax=Spiroplasma endosymbiont of Panorpa germanica TaxID=3066314 RepID=UPI0030D3FF1A